MPKFDITTFSLDEEEVTYRIAADDEAAALGQLIDEHGAELAHGFPFVVVRVHVARSGALRSGRSKKRRRARTVDAAAAKPAAKKDLQERIDSAEPLPEPTAANLAAVRRYLGTHFDELPIEGGS